MTTLELSRPYDICLEICLERLDVLSRGVPGMVSIRLDDQYLFASEARPSPAP